MRAARAASLALVAWLALASGCRRRQERPPPPLVPTSALGRPFMLRQQVTAQAEDERRAMQVVVQLADSELVLVGLGPHGARVMQATQQGVDVEQKVLVPVRLPFTALDVLGDVHRVLFRGCPPPEAGEGSLEVTCTDRGAHVRERHVDGRLRERSYADTPKAEPHTRITYHGDGVIIPTRVELDNLRYGYRLTIETLSQKWLK